MTLLLTTTGRASLVGHTYHESNPAVGHDSQVNPALPTLPVASVAAASKLYSIKAKLQATIRRFAKMCFSKCRLSASRSQRCLKTLQLAQVVLIAMLVVQLVFFIRQDSQRSKGTAQADQYWEQTQKYWELVDRIDNYEEVARMREQLQDLRIEALEERVERLELRGSDSCRSASPQRTSSTTPLF